MENFIMKIIAIAALAALPFATQAMDAKTAESATQSAQVKVEQKVQTVTQKMQDEKAVKINEVKD